MKIEQNKVVEFCYELEVDGQIVDQTSKERPLDYIHGTGSLLPKLEAHIEGMEAGTSFDNVVKTTCFLKEMSDFAAFNKIYGETFTSKPARSCVAVKTLPKNGLVEVEAIAVIE